ncbi:cobalamin (vitamin B12) biosynthesis CbiX protein [Magnetococcus marinus MC-1]|uniref:Cobalamin (Vitamin B12) biosynthesis CbiX protein n=1 Tax=Magnetococcus marinus (strain ATCC BAA-1437 / JCM 17883 / MC-1) TaxID=156889 RepID=A0LCD2_MAGMM|nr:sirohydrochlorin chelatase [Magnetococcus marinus]ABK45625.1 cobalamin (vitamin B12) biosynthesis CbiX protein [Magnetococcus marinus MC-1]
MSDTILLVGHGSRHAKGNREVEKFAEMWQKRHGDWRVELCFIEFAEVLLAQGLDRAAQGSTRVVVVPLVINAAGHVKMEIPEQLAAARQRHEGVEFVYVSHFGSVEGVFKAVKRQLHRAMLEMHLPDPCTTGVVVLARGSSDIGANGEVAKMARWIWEETPHELVDIAFTGITFPRLEQVVQRQVKLGMSQIVVAPYYLFTGTLMERIRQQVARLERQYPTIAFALGGYFGFEEEIFDLLDHKVGEALTGVGHQPLMECDGCKYRAFAQEHGHGQHHHH